MADKDKKIELFDKYFTQAVNNICMQAAKEMSEECINNFNKKRKKKNKSRRNNL